MRSRSAIASTYSASVTVIALLDARGHVVAVVGAAGGEELRVGLRGLAVLDRGVRGIEAVGVLEAHLDRVERRLDGAWSNTRWMLGLERADVQVGADRDAPRPPGSPAPPVSAS